MSWNPFRDSWPNWSNDPSNQHSERHQSEIAGAQDWRSTHSIDPNTGDLIGTPGLIPGQYGLEFQLLHEQGRDRARQARMRSAANYARGALGLMQSFRPGGGATLEAGQYNALAQIEMNRAQMLQPLDLMGDYRRHESALASQRVNRAREVSTIVQIGALAVSALTGGAAGAALAGVGMAGAALFGGGGGGGGAAGSNPLGQGPYGPKVYPTSGATAGAVTGAQGGAATGVGGQQPLSGPQGAPQAGEGGLAATLAQPYGGPGAGVTKQKPQPGGAGQPQAGGAGGAPGQPGQPGQGGGGGFAPMGGAGGPQPGADGNFLPVAYASAAAGGMVDPLQGVVMNLSLADRLESDPAWSQISFAVDQRLRLRVRGAAA
jgi:hypothetical protein